MPTLIIHAPYSEVQQNQKQSFNQILATGRGNGHAINKGLFGQLSPGDEVVVICKVHRKQAAGKIKELVPTVRTGTGMQRYDVLMECLELVAFTHGGTKMKTRPQQAGGYQKDCGGKPPLGSGPLEGH